MTRKPLLFALSILLLGFLLPSKGAAQCAFEITGVVENASGQPADSQLVFLQLDSVLPGYVGTYTLPNGEYYFSMGTVSCGTVATGVVYTIACGDTLYYPVTLTAGQPITQDFVICPITTPCPGNVSTSPIAQGIALTYNLPGVDSSDILVTFGDNPNAVYFAPADHVYADSGLYTVCVNAYSATCVFDTCFTVYIELFNGTDSCTVDGSIYPYGPQGIEFGWQGSNGLGLPPVSVVWTFGDGTATNNYPNGGTHDYEFPGVYEACITVTWATGCVATDCDSIVINDTLPSGMDVCGWAAYLDGNNDTVPVDCGLVYLIAIDSLGQHVVIDSVSLSANGYCFYNQAPGNYTVLVVPCDSLLMPTYLGNVLFWQDAQVYSGNGGIILVPGQSVQGPGLIGGTIVWGDKAVGDPIPGVRVLLLDIDAHAITFAVTDAEGYYFFDNLPYGTYRVYPEYPGVVTYPGLVVLSAENPAVESANFSLTEQTFMGIAEAPVAIKGLYPNPAADKAVLTLVSAEAGNGNIQLIDLAGKTVASFPVTVTKGQQTIGIDVNTLRAGMYTVTLSVRGRQMHTKLIRQ